MDQTNRPARILVVDDDRDTAAILVRYLQSEGLDPIEANSGEECLRLVREKEVDVILLDLMMPDMDGFQICKVLKEHPSTAEIPIILISARDDIEARAESMSLGVGDFLAKPISRRQLAASIRGQIEVVATERKTTATLSRIERRGANSKD